MKLIDKDAVVSEIKRRRDLHYKYYMKNGVGSIAECKYDEDREILSFLDTLEVKEVQEEPKPKLSKQSVDDSMAELEEKIEFFTQAHIGENADEILAQMRGEEPASKVWHNASEEPADKSHCLIFFGDKDEIGHYLYYEPVLYNKQEKVFVTAQYPHPTGYKVEQKSIDGGCVAEVYKNQRDRIQIADITEWCYLNDFTKLDNSCKISKDLQEPYASNDFELALTEMIAKAQANIVEPWVIAAQWKDELIRLFND